ncbi:MAG: histidinol-phosphatase HisJ family protein [Candidatus Geothermarchaeales archaeon]
MRVSKVNYHIHTLFSDGGASMEDYVREAISLKFDEIGFSDHLVILPNGEVGGESIRLSRLESYVEKIGSLKKRYEGEISIRCGLEIDLFPETENSMRRLLSEFEFDYLLCSVHRVDDFVFDLPSSLTLWNEMGEDQILETYRDYYSSLNLAIESGTFDVVAHPDIIKKFGFRPRGDITDETEKTVGLISKMRMCVEVNASGLRHPVGEIYPSPEFLRMCRERGVSITLGTDAHRVEDLGRGFQDLIEYIRGVGYGEITLFEKRMRTRVSI